MEPDTVFPQPIVESSLETGFTLEVIVVRVHLTSGLCGFGNQINLV